MACCMQAFAFFSGFCYNILIVLGSLRIRQALCGTFCNPSSGCKTPVKYNCKK